VSSVLFHPHLPLIISGAEDGTVRLWHATTYKLENTLGYGMERVWTISCLKGTNKVALGYDDGTVMIKLGQEEPVMSMSQGKVLYARNQDVIQVDLKKGEFKDIVDGDRVQFTTNELPPLEIFPQYMQHSPSGRLVVCLVFSLPRFLSRFSFIFYFVLSAFFLTLVLTCFSFSRPISLSPCRPSVVTVSTSFTRLCNSNRSRSGRLWSSSGARTAPKTRK
jgi:WD40 repeat protein